MRRLLLLLAVILVAAAGILLIVKMRKPAQPQYVFLICMDAVRPDHLGCYGYKIGTSPRIDDLARRGAIFEDAISQAPWTVPSIQTILTSKFPSQQDGAPPDQASEDQSQALPGQVSWNQGQTSLDIVQMLTSAGYQTALFTGGMLLRNKVSASELTLSALEWLRKNAASRCLVVMHHYETHFPYVGDEECIQRLDPDYQGPYSFRFGDMNILKKARVGRLTDAVNLTSADLKHIKALYDCQIVRADRSVGMLIDSLAAWHWLEKSMIVVFADHGEEFLEHGSLEHGQTVYDESIKVPLVIFCPSLIPRHKAIGEQVGLIDLGPTVLDALAMPLSPSFEGRSLMPLVSPHFKPTSQTQRPSGIPITCLISEAIAHRSEKKALRCPPWKLIFDPFFGAAELYNIKQDPAEKDNVIDIDRETASSLTDILLNSMEAYYPGGWNVAWRTHRSQADSKGATWPVIRGKIEVSGGLIEAVGHNIFPEVDTPVDSVSTAPDKRQVTFRSATDSTWKGVEVRMASRRNAQINLVAEGRRTVRLLVGKAPRGLTFPVTLTPEEAAVDRRDLHGLFNQDSLDCIIFWIDPGKQPAATLERQEDLKRNLIPIGYIE